MEKQGEALELPARPYLKPWYRLAESNGSLLLEFGQTKIALQGKAVEKLLPVLLPLLDGTRTLEQISEQLGQAIEPAVRSALATLAQRDLLTEGPPLPADTPPALAETAWFLSATGADARSVGEAGEALQRATIAVVGTGSLAKEIASDLRDAGIGDVTVVDWAAEPDALGAVELAVVAPDPYELARLADWNRLALASGMPWLQVLPFDGRIAVVGPLYVPGETCCYECYRRRRRANLHWDEEEARALDESPAGYPAPSPLKRLIAGCAAMAALDRIYRSAGGEAASPWAATIHVLRWDQGIEASRHHVYRVPRCPECFPDDLGTTSPWHGADSDA